MSKTDIRQPFLLRGITLFSDLFLHNELSIALDEQGFEAMTPVQKEAIPLAMEGKDLLVSAETGSGKTVAFLLPILNQLLSEHRKNVSTRALILTPTRELARQILKHCNNLIAHCGLTADVITGGADYMFQERIFRRNPEIIIATPGRLLELVEQDTADLSDLEFLVLDEADRMLDMGFSKDVLSIASACRPTCQTLLFSATLKHEGIKRIADTILNDPESLTINTHRDQHSSIKQQIVLADDKQHKQTELLWLLNNESAEKVIVFTNTREQAQEVGTFLVGHEQAAEVLHGELPQLERNKIMDRIRRGHSRILVATDVAARGLDVEGVDLVINFDMARTGDVYVHRIGRTGRAGRPGLAISLIMHNEWNLMASIERYLKQSFKRRKIKELAGAYQGPKKLKASGRAAGSKKKKIKKATTPKKKSKK